MQDYNKIIMQKDLSLKNIKNAENADKIVKTKINKITLSNASISKLFTQSIAWC